MEFQEFIKQKEKICNLCDDCSGCELSNEKNGKDVSCEYLMRKYPQIAEAIVQKWADEHKQQTNAEKFKEVFGEYSFKNGDDCDTCIYELPCRGCNWWNEEYIPPEREEE